MIASLSFLFLFLMGGKECEIVANHQTKMLTILYSLINQKIIGSRPISRNQSIENKMLRLTQLRAITISTECIAGGKCLKLVNKLTITAPGPSLKTSL